LKLFREFVTLKKPSRLADTLIQQAAPLCAGGGAAPGPGAGAGVGAIGMAGACSSTVLAMNAPGTVYSWPLSSEKWSCHRSSSPGDENSTWPWCETTNTSTVPSRLAGHISSNSLFQVRSPIVHEAEPSERHVPTDCAFSLGSGSCGV
jgi:hypothetical protein